ncbi:TspO/MBR-related protein [Umbelopsis sp. AD052]|nr:TspO/MBR-related protein [Umbelopsis sp. AD052]
MDLEKPSARPPNWVFGPVWTCLYTAMGYGSHLIANHAAYSLSPETKELAQLGLNLYYSQLALNFAWTPLFFGVHKVKLAAIDCGFLTANVAAMIYTWWKVDRKAAQLMLPYLGWSSFATYLTISIYQRNFSKKARRGD